MRLHNVAVRGVLSRRGPAAPLYRLESKLLEDGSDDVAHAFEQLYSAAKRP